MSLAGKFKQNDLHSVGAAAPFAVCGMPGSLIARNDRRSGIALVELYPYVKNTLNLIERAHIIARTMSMDDGNRTRSGGSGSPHRITADRGKSRNLIGDVVHAVVSKHATHGKTRQIYTVAVDIVQFSHLVYKLQNEIDVGPAGYIPGLIDTIRENRNELLLIGKSFYSHLPFLVVGVLIHSMTGNKQRPIGRQVRRNVFKIVACFSANLYIVGIRAERCHANKHH